MSDAKLVELCLRGIMAFWKARSKTDGSPRMKRKDLLYDAEYLSENGEEGLRYGALGWTDLKLRYTKKRGFYLDSNGMDEKDFLAFQQVVAAEMAAEGLKFYQMPA